MERVTSMGIGRILAVIALIIIVILLVVGKMALMWEGALFLLLTLAILL